MKRVLASSVMVCLLAGPLGAQPGVTYAPQAYPTAGEAMRHMLPPPPGCVAHDGASLCDPTFIQEVGPGGVISWRPTVWAPKGSKGTCSDETGHVWSTCDGPSDGRYRISLPAPPPSRLPPQSPSAAPARRPVIYYDTAEDAKSHLQPAPPECADAAGKPPCVPTFGLTMNAAGKVFWRPAGWQRSDPPGACVDATGHDWSSCGAPPPGRYRWRIPPPPLVPLEVPRPPPLLIGPVSLQAYSTVGEAMRHLTPPSPGCVADDGASICDPTFIRQVRAGDAIFWLPSLWVAKGSKGICSDETGRISEACDGPSPGRYRITAPPPRLPITPAPASPNAPVKQPVTYYETAEEADSHMQPAPADCADATGKAPCVPTFHLTMNAAGKVFWRPAGWQRSDPPGACVDKTGHDWSSCGAPPPGRYRLRIAPPPAVALDVPPPPPVSIPPIPWPQPAAPKP